MMMKNVLKYPGSKWRIADQLVSMIPSHHTYVEPYLGSGAVLFSKPPSDIEIVNDLDCEVTNLFLCIQEDAEKLARLVMTTPYSRKMYDHAFDLEPLVNDIFGIDPFRQAATFLLKCWQGHGFRTNGYKVGWKSDVQGREKMYALWDWYNLPERIINIAERLRTVQIECKPAVDVIRRFNYHNVFMYIDPPYVWDTRSGKQYAHEMTDRDHEELLQALITTKAAVMISGYESDLYNDMLRGWYKEQFESHAEHGGKRLETVWMNYERQYSMFEISGVIL